jgi:hypothetical protein
MGCLKIMNHGLRETRTFDLMLSDEADGPFPNTHTFQV